MDSLHYLIAIAALAFTLPAQAATTDPELVIYRFPGVADNGGAPNAGMATSFHCTNFSGVTENVRFVARNWDSTIIVNTAFPIQHLTTISASTHNTAAYADIILSPGALINQGTMAIAATATNIVCTAMTIDASNAVAVGVALRGIRFNPALGSQE